MAAAAAAQERLLVTRHVLCVISEGLPRMAVLGAGDVSFGPGCLALRCQGSEMTAGVDVERHQTRSGHADIALAGRRRGTMAADLGAPRRHEHRRPARMASRPRPGPRHLEHPGEHLGGQQAADLEDRLLDDDEAVEEPSDGPERWLVQLWP